MNVRLLPRFAPVALAVSLALGAPVLSAGCVASGGNTHVARGEQYHPGLATYDEYFKLVHDLQVEVHGVDDDRKASRSGLSQALGLMAGAGPDRILEVLKSRIAELKGKGATFTAQGSQVRATGNGDAQTLATQASQCVTAERALADNMRKVPARATSLLAMNDTLSGTVDRDFTLLRAKEVKAELDAARYVLGRMRDATPDIAASSQRLADDIMNLFGLGTAPAASSAPPPPKPTSTATHKPPPPPGTGTGAPPPPKPTATTKPDDFNP